MSAVTVDMMKTIMKVPTIFPIKYAIANNGSFKVKYIVIFGMENIKFKMVVTTARIKAKGMGSIFFSSKRLFCTELNLSRIPPIFGAKKLYINAIIAVLMKEDMKTIMGIPIIIMIIPMIPKALSPPNSGNELVVLIAAMAAVCMPNINIGATINIKIKT